ncbi:MAG: hypothetical protein IT326_04725 [Anaerolineae bacterium]|nr:hypothetical protein [Anaerolineae bacterium]
MATDDEPSKLPLLIRQANAVWRDTFVVDSPPPHFLETSLKRLERLPCFLAHSHTPWKEQPDELRVLERVSRNVARSGYDSLLRFQFADFRLTNLRPVLARLRRPPDEFEEQDVLTAAQEADRRRTWVTVTPVLLLHRAGVGIAEYYVTFHTPSGPGHTPEEVIELVRMGFQPQVLSLPAEWASALPADLEQTHIRQVIPVLNGVHVTVAGVRDLSQHVFADRLEHDSPEPAKGKRRLKQKPPAESQRPTGSTTVILNETNPMPPEHLPPFVEEYSAPLRGIGAMDVYYHERASWLVERELHDNLSSDQEAGVFLLGNSELILYNQAVWPILENIRQRRLADTEAMASLYLSAHTIVLMEWVYLQEALLRAYIRRLDLLVAAPVPERRAMIATLQNALADLIQYQENITPYATRIEFLERARRYHKLDDLVERFERKQNLLLTYATEYHDFREARAAEFLNWIAGLLAAAELTNIIITLAGITPQNQPTLYVAINIVSIVLVFAVLWFLLRRIRR